MKKSIKTARASNSMANISQKWLNSVDATTFEIAEVFTHGYNKEMHGSEIARLLNLPQRTIHRKLGSLCNIGVLKFLREGKNKLYSLNKTAPVTKQFMILTEGYKTLRFMKKDILVGQLFNEKPCGLIVFGSYARGDNKKESDIDVVFLSNKTKKIEEFISKSPVEIHAHFSNLSDIVQKIKNRDVLALEIKENHIIFGDIEETAISFMENQND